MRCTRRDDNTHIGVHRDGLASDRHDRLAGNDSDDLLGFVRMERNHLARLVERHPNRHRASTDLAIDDHR